MLEAFLGSEGQQWILMNESASLDAHRKYWLVRKSAATALSQGYYQFTFLKGSEYHVTTSCIGGPAWPPILEKTPVLQPRQFANCSASGMDTPDVYSLQILSRFAKPMRWSCIDREIARKRSQPHSQLPVFSLWRLFPERITMTSTIGWHMVPAFLRIQVYRCLAFMGARVYGQSCSLKVQQLPFGMYLKTSDVKWHESLANEYETLRLVRRYTRIPVPRPLDLVSYMGESYLLTSQIPGLRLGWCIDTLSDDEVGMLVHDLQGYIGELRAIPKEVAPDYAITNALGKPCFDYRLNAALDYDEDRGDFVGPFADEEQFNETLQCGALPGVTHRSGHEIVFSHGDLNMRNILVRNGRLSGVVDWETSGWYPEYWDYTKAHYITKLHRRWLRIVDKTFQQYGGYEDELATERQLWDYCF
ncbi:hypothetical protein TruAng_002380 [Truncatella angustata]|nr:hypothetical protein TruAng_002380 [Truncatella angustata]